MGCPLWRCSGSCPHTRPDTHPNTDVPPYLKQRTSSFFRGFPFVRGSGAFVPSSTHAEKTSGSLFHCGEGTVQSSECLRSVLPRCPLSQVPAEFSAWPETPDARVPPALLRNSSG